MSQFNFAGRSHQTLIFIRLQFFIASTENQKGFDFTERPAQSNKFTENKHQAGEIEIINISVNADFPVHNNIRDFIQDDQMFRQDCDPTFFDSMRIEENLNNNIGLDHIKDLEAIYSDNWSIPPDSDFEFFSELFDGDMAEKKDEPTPPPSPIPAPASPVIVEAVEVKSEDPSFDLINFIIFGQVRVKEPLQVAQLLTKHFSFVFTERRLVDTHGREVSADLRSAHCHQR